MCGREGEPPGRLKDEHNAGAEAELTHLLAGGQLYWRSKHFPHLEKCEGFFPGKTRIQQKGLIFALLLKRQGGHEIRIS